MRRAILSSALFIALGAAALLIAHAGGETTVRGAAQLDQVQAAPQLHAAR